MLLKCQECNAKVDAEVLESYTTYHEMSGLHYKFTFCKCPQCNSPLLAAQDGPGEIISDPSRIFPQTSSSISLAIPENIREAFLEAEKCHDNQAFTASAIMCRKTLEGVCKNHGIDEGSLAKSLEKMKEEEIIEGRLYKWSDELRLVGNEAAHDVDITVNSQDAIDTLDFTKAVLEYVYTFRDKFEKFRERRSN